MSAFVLLGSVSKQGSPATPRFQVSQTLKIPIWHHLQQNMVEVRYIPQFSLFFCIDGKKKKKSNKTKPKTNKKHTQTRKQSLFWGLNLDTHKRSSQLEVLPEVPVWFGY